MRKTGFGVLLFAAIAALFWLTPAAFAADEDVTISGFAFSPASIEVSVGDTVTWTNNDSVAHTATADGGSFDTGNLGNGASDSVTFDTAGTFDYHCSIHSSMTGRVAVLAAGGGGGTPTTPPTDTAAGTPPTGSVAFGLFAVLFAGLSSVLVARRFARRS